MTSFEAMVKACIDHKANVTTGGHEIRIDVIPNDIAARYLDMGRKMETAWLIGSAKRARALLTLGVAPAIVSETFLLYVRQTAHLNRLLGGSQACVCVRI